MGHEDVDLDSAVAPALPTAAGAPVALMALDILSDTQLADAQETLSKLGHRREDDVEAPANLNIWVGQLETWDNVDLCDMFQ